jgi:membrane protein YqaA with SNARE-associated domain
MLRSLYDKVMRLAGHPQALWWLALIAFLESSVFPIPPDVMLVPLVLAAPQRAFRYAAVCTVASVIGGWVGYAIGYALFETIGRPIIAFYHLQAGFECFSGTFNRYGAWIVLIKGLTPIPYKLVTITAGVTHLDLTTFSIASVISRGGRFFLVALLLWYFGEPIRRFIERYLTWVTTGFFAAVIGGFLILGSSSELSTDCAPAHARLSNFFDADQDPS